MQKLYQPILISALLLLSGYARSAQIEDVTQSSAPSQKQPLTRAEFNQEWFGENNIRFLCFTDDERYSIAYYKENPSPLPEDLDSNTKICSDRFDLCVLLDNIENKLPFTIHKGWKKLSAKVLFEEFFGIWRSAVLWTQLDQNDLLEALSQKEKSARTLFYMVKDKGFWSGKRCSL